MCETSFKAWSVHVPNIELSLKVLTSPASVGSQLLYHKCMIKSALPPTPQESRPKAPCHRGHLQWKGWLSSASVRYMRGQVLSRQIRSLKSSTILLVNGSWLKIGVMLALTSPWRTRHAWSLNGRTHLGAGVIDPFLRASNKLVARTVFNCW